ncbi:hypothetical protein ACWEKM_20620 [Streptomyces sp. NPDC004752]
MAHVDCLYADEYRLTLSAPVRAADRFAGVAAADVRLRHFEAATPRCCAACRTRPAPSAT